MKNNHNPERFRNRAEALVWLQDKGQISRGKFYNDCASGHVAIHPDKSISRFQVAEYAEKIFRFSHHDSTPKPSSKLYKEDALCNQAVKKLNTIQQILRSEMPQTLMLAAIVLVAEATT